MNHYKGSFELILYLRQHICELVWSLVWTTLFTLFYTVTRHVFWFYQMDTLLSHSSFGTNYKIWLPYHKG